MSSELELQLTGELRRRVSMEQREVNPPPNLRTSAIAKRYNLSIGDVIRLLKELQ